MSEPTPAITPRHYQALCALSLLAIFLVQLQMHVDQRVNALLLAVGAFSFVYRSRLNNPLFVLLLLAVGQLVLQYQENQYLNPDFRSMRFLDVADILLAAATLLYLAGQYRLYSLWFQMLPDGVAGRPDLRSENTMTLEELLWLVFPVPLFALAAEVGLLWLKQPWDLVGFPARWRQFLVLAWLVLLGLFVAAHFFRYWRRLQMDRATALLLLQDVLWNETRREQRRINRWIAWRKVQRGD